MIANSVASYSGEVEACVEFLCSQGCIRVSNYIEALEKGRTFPEVAAFTAEQRHELLAELVSIMAVYDGVCSS